MDLFYLVSSAAEDVVTALRDPGAMSLHGAAVIWRPSIDLPAVLPCEPVSRRARRWIRNNPADFREMIKSVWWRREKVGA